METTMNLHLTISLDEPSLSAINNLADALRLAGTPIFSVQNAVTHATDAAAEDTAAAEAEEAARIEAEAEAKAEAEEAAAAKAKADAKAKAEAKAKAKAEADAKAKAEAEAKAKAEAEKAAAAEEETAEPEAAGDTPDRIPSEEDLVTTFMAFLPKDLTKEERDERYAFAKPLLARFGVKKATELAEEHRALVMNLIIRKMHGDDVDPVNDGYKPLHEEDEDEDVV